MATVLERPQLSVALPTTKLLIGNEWQGGV
jgi:hypothetical protein